MTSPNPKKQDEIKKGFKALVAVVIGAVVGIGVAVTGVVALLVNKKNRNKVKEVLEKIKNQAREYKENR